MRSTAGIRAAREPRRRPWARLGRPGLARALAVSGALLARQAGAAELGGEAGVTSDAIYRGMSESSGRPALMLDVHASTLHGTLAGAAALGALSTADQRAATPGTVAELEAYLGQRVALGADWNAELTAHSHHFLGGSREIPSSYQELDAQLSYLDLWSLSVAAIPDAPQRPGYTPPGIAEAPAGEPAQRRYTAWAVATQLQWLLTARFSLTAGAGYYLVPGGADVYAGWEAPRMASGRGYAYGSSGLAYQWQSWRVDVGYFLTGSRAAPRLYPFPAANQQVAATLSWRF